MTKHALAHQHRDVATATQARLPLFQATRRPQMMTTTIRTSHGEAVVTGRLGQRHMDLIECARLVAESQGLDGADQYCCVVDPHRLRSAMSAGRARVCYEQLDELAADLKNCSISALKVYSCPEIGVRVAGILSTVLTATVGKVLGRAGHGNVLRERELWMLQFSKPWTLLIGADLPISYRGQLPRIVSLRNGFSQAVARFMLSHAPGAHYGRAALMNAIRPRGRGTRRWAELLEDATMLADAGVLVDRDAVRTVERHCHQNPGGCHPNPGERHQNPGASHSSPGAYRLIGQ